MAWIRDRALALALMAMFLLLLVGQGLTGFVEYNNEHAQHGDPAVAIADYLATGQLWEALFEKCTSAHVTMVIDTRLRDLVNEFGRTHAQAVWDAGLAAIATIDDIIRAHDIDAGFEWVDGYLHAPLDNDASEASENLKADATPAGELGFDAEYLESVPLVGRPGVRFADQAHIHPRQYLAGVAKAFVALGGRIHEHSKADEFCDDPRRVKANGHTVTCADVVISGPAEPPLPEAD